MNLELLIQRTLDRAGASVPLRLSADARHSPRLVLTALLNSPAARLKCLAQARAPKGGVNIGGKFYPGGKFIPGKTQAEVNKAAKGDVAKPDEKPAAKKQPKPKSKLKAKAKTKSEATEKAKTKTDGDSKPKASGGLTAAQKQQALSEVDVIFAAHKEKKIEEAMAEAEKNKPKKEGAIKEIAKRILAIGKSLLGKKEQPVEDDGMGSFPSSEDQDKTAAALMKHDKPSKYNERQIEMMQQWQGSGYMEFNHIMHGGDPSLLGDELEEIKEDTEVLRKIAQQKLPKPVTTYRGVDQWLGEKALEMAKYAHQSGGLVRMHGFTATSLSPEKAKEFGGDVMLEITGQTGAYISGATKSKNYGHEKEVLKDHGLVYKITGSEQRMLNGKKVNVVKMEEVQKIDPARDRVQDLNKREKRQFSLGKDKPKFSESNPAAFEFIVPDPDTGESVAVSGSDFAEGG